jgi:membrane-associated phospholipid phosphatase
VRNCGQSLLAIQLVLVAAFAVLSWLVVTGACTRFDQYGIDHWMAHVGTGPTHTSLWLVFRPYPGGGNASQIAFNVWTFPASVLVSGAVLVLCCVVLDRRGQRRTAGAWVVAWVVANAVEVAGKGLLHRPDLSASVAGMRVQMTSFETSFPSGHTARALVVAFMLAAVWPRVAWVAGLWAAGACALLVVSGDHTPSDVVGGVLAALLVVTWVRSYGRNETETLEVGGRRRTLPHLSLEDT